MKMPKGIILVGVISDLPKTLAFMPGMKASKSETNRKGSRYSHTAIDGFSESDVNKKNTPHFSAGMFIIVALLLGVGFGTMQNNGKSESTPTVSDKELAPHYVVYSEEAFTQASSRGRTILYFWAAWCSTCAVLDDELKERGKELPEDVTILRINFDTEKELKRRYEIITQHTLVQVDKDGNEITRWIGGNVDVVKDELR